jgi:1,4-alpha-glucan branching enzyme
MRKKIPKETPRKTPIDKEPDLKTLTRKAVAKLINFEESHPSEILGPRILEERGELIINVYLPLAVKVSLVIKGSRKKIEMERLNKEGVFQAKLSGYKKIPRYKIIWKSINNELIETEDPYAFKPVLGEIDLHLLGEGTHHKSFEKLGSKVTVIDGVKGVQFVVWAPNAKSISVAGEFNDWKEGAHPMTVIENSGYWGLFIPGLGEGTTYKYAVKTKSNVVYLRADPYAFRSELRPSTASIVESLKGYKWKDKDWIKERSRSLKGKLLLGTKPISIYEVHLGSWKKDYDNTDYPNEWGYKNYRQLAHEIVEYVKEMNYTHIELLPVSEHPLDISWGYQVTNYFAPTSRYGTPQDLMYFVDYCHTNGIGVILDWVPSHFPTDVHGLGEFDGKRIYEYANLKKGFHKGWGTYVFDYGRNEVINFLISNALFWMEKYHIDGLRVDAVASMLYLDYSRDPGEWEPNIYGSNENLEAIAFLKKLNETVHNTHKGVIMIAEESSSWPGVTRPVHLGGLGFDMKWNMGWMHDILAYFSMDPIFRKFHHGKLTFAIWYAFNENFVLPLSHDEVVHLKKSVAEKMPGDEWHKFANLRLLFGFMFGHPGKKLNFMGNDIAQYREWNSETQLDWEALDYDLNRKFHEYFKELNRLYSEEPALHEDDFDSTGFQWIDFSNADESIICFVRYNLDKTKMMLFTFNMTPVLRNDYVLGVPYHGFYREILNSNAEQFGGSGVGNLGGVYSEDVPRFDFPYSVKVTLPPLAVNIYSFEKAGAKAARIPDAELEQEYIPASEESAIETTAKTPEVLPEEIVVKVVTEEIDELIPDDKEEKHPATIEVKKEAKAEEDEMSDKIKQILKKIKKY